MEYNFGWKLSKQFGVVIVVVIIMHNIYARVYGEFNRWERRKTKQAPISIVNIVCWRTAHGIVRSTWQDSSSNASLKNMACWSPFSDGQKEKKKSVGRGRPRKREIGGVDGVCP